MILSGANLCSTSFVLEFLGPEKQKFQSLTNEFQTKLKVPPFWPVNY